MPWKETDVMTEKERFVTLAQTGRFTVSELCSDFGISRKTGHKYLQRYEAQGRKGLSERSRRPKHSRCATAKEVEQLILKERRKHPTSSLNLHQSFFDRLEAHDSHSRTIEKGL